jgi:putative alpha-1,2-mannosidase
VQSAELNGKPLDRAWLTHDKVVRGWKMVLHMGPKPSGSATNARPPPQVVKL